MLEGAVITDREQALAEIDIYGFTVVNDVLDVDQVGKMKAALVRCERKVGSEHQNRGSARHVANLPTLDPIFFTCLDHPKILPLLIHYLGEKMILGSLNARIVRPGDPEQGLHSDISAGLLNMASPVMMNTVWMLDDFSEENGGTRIVPGSHKSGFDEPPEGFCVRHVHQAEASAGSVLVSNGQSWQGGGANRSLMRRHALFGHYRKDFLRFQVDPHEGFPREWLSLLNSKQKRLLRMGNGLGVPHAADSHD